MDGKQLRNSILQWAIQGKLVPQDPNDEPASVLLERIREEKARLVKEKKLKRDKNESIIYRGDDNSYYEKFLATGEVKCIDDEIPLELPGGWEWSRLGSLSFDSADGPFGSNLKREHYTNNREVRIIQLSNIGEFGWKDSNVRYTTYAHLTNISRSEAFAGDIIIAKMMPAGRAIVCPALESKYVLSSDAVRFSFSIELERTYLYYAINSPVFLEQVYGDVQGITRVRTSLQKLRSYLLPIPPINEQKKIVEIIDRLLTLTFNYEKAHNAINELNNHVKSLLKRSILQEAIQGRLVAQHDTDEPASVLLERIKIEKERLIKEKKIKRDKQESIIYRGDDNKYYERRGKEVICIDDEIPFEIPNNWMWVRLGTIYSHCTGKALNSSNRDGTVLEYITTSNLYWNRFVLDKLRTMPFTEDELEKCTVVKGDLLVCEGGDIGRAAIWDYDYEMRIQNHIHKLRGYIPLCTMFFYYVFYLYKHSGLIGGKGIGIQGLSSGALHKLLVPLPPLTEQQRIVDAISVAWQVL